MSSFSSLLVDYYQLAMAEVYLAKGLVGPSAFEFFVRRLPENRNFLVAAGLSQALDYLLDLEFSDEELLYLKGLGFSSNLLDFLKDLSFKGDVWAMPEGTLFFENEPILRVEAPLPVAQLVETRLINILHFQTLIASKAARVRLSAGKLPLIDFGLRRSHEAEAGLMAARACYISGFNATATVEAGCAFGIPVAGTMAHSFVLAHENEEQAFRNFIEIHRENTILLIDTFDTLKAAKLATGLFHEYRKKGIKIKGVRIDSGDLLVLSKKVRQIFDEAGCSELAIFVSGGLDEFGIYELLRKGAPIDGFGVGTMVDTSADAPYLDCAYKMVEYSGKARMKFSAGKATIPFKKQVFRFFDRDGRFQKDVIGTADENSGGTPLLEKVVEKGRLLKREGLADVRARVEEGLTRLPEALRSIHEKADFTVGLSHGIEQYLNKEQGKV